MLHDLAMLIFSDGTVFEGVALGAHGIALGEVLFNTAMTGYQEVLTDPSYLGQIVTFTQPHIGNTGINCIDYESNQISAAGVVVRESSAVTSSWRATQSFENWLKAYDLVGIAGVDTRRLTHYLREKGSQMGCILSDKTGVSRASMLARAVSTLRGLHVTRKVGTTYDYSAKQSSRAPTTLTTSLIKNTTKHIVVYDFGVKDSILQHLAARGCQVTVVPALTRICELLALKPDALVLSNGPGDPQTFIKVIQLIKKIIMLDLPILGICLGHQLLALAMGARIVKLSFGHHGINHPVCDLATGRISITSQNHNYAVHEMNLPSVLKVTHRSLFDGSIQGMRHISKPIWGIQGHPEGGPGPLDASSLLDEFLLLLQVKSCEGEIYAEAS